MQLADFPIARPGDPLSRVDTPALVLDLSAFERNLRKMQDWADRHRVTLRPHAKAHKCPDVALRQLALGAAGICCQKISEAVPFAQAGVRDIHISNEVVGEAKLPLLAWLARQATVSVCVDDAGNIDALAQAMRGAGATLTVLVELDVGAGRCGVVTDAEALALAQRIAAAPELRFGGLQAYHGGAQHLRTSAERKAVCTQAGQRAKTCADFLARHGLPCERITGGGTGTAEFDAPGGIFTELQAGSYAFMDGDYGANTWDGELVFEHSLFLFASVMSATRPGHAVADAGLKSTTVEFGQPAVFQRPGVEYVGASDEHGVLRITDNAMPLALGDKLKLVPSHVDPTFNLHDVLVVFRDEKVEALWPIAARGLSR